MAQDSEYISDNKWIPKEEADSIGNKQVWSTKSIGELLVALDKGYNPHVRSPFYEGKQHLRKGNIVFEYTDTEIREIAKCAKDIVYFAEKYAVVMTDDGVQKVKMRDYQKDLLRSFQNNRFNVVCAARQMGKCFFHDTPIDIRDASGITRTISIGNIYYNTLRKQRSLKVIEWLKWKLWSLYDTVNNF